MKKKFVTIITAVFLFSSGYVIAESVRSYKGNPIVKIFFENKEIPLKEVPAHIENGNTLVPISMLKNFGLQTEWDGTNLSVTVNNPIKEEYTARLYTPTIYYRGLLA